MSSLLTRINTYTIYIVLFFALLLYTIPLFAAGPDRLIFGVHPYLPKEEIQKRFTPLIEYLSKHLKLPIELHIAKNYETHIENVGNNAVDFAYMGPSSYVTLTQKYGSRPLLARLEIDGKPFFHGYIVTAGKNPAVNLAQLRGKRFAFGSPHSTMSYLVPRYMLNEAGVSIESLGYYKFLGNHRNVALGVLLGEFDAGAVKEEVYFKFRDRGLRKIAVSPPISEHVFVSKKEMPSKLHASIADALYKLSETSAGRNILTSIKKRITKLVPAKDENYDNLRVIMH